MLGWSASMIPAKLDRAKRDLLAAAREREGVERFGKSNEARPFGHTGFRASWGPILPLNLSSLSHSFSCCEQVSLRTSCSGFTMLALPRAPSFALNFLDGI